MTSEQTESRALRALRDLIESGRPLAYVHTAEERRITQLCREAAQKYFTPPAPLWIWTITDGMRRDGAAAPSEHISKDPLSPRGALEFIVTHDGPGIFLLKDFHEALHDAPELRRRLRDIYELGQTNQKLVVLASPVKFIPDEIERSIVYIELAVPDLPELIGFVKEQGKAVVANGGTAASTDDAVTQIARALQGLTLDDAEHAVRRALAQKNALDESSIPMLLEEKRLLVNRAGFIEYIPTESGLDNIGGLGIMKQWLIDRRKLFLMRDQISAEIVPKGVLVMGISGCGKSLSIKAIASCFELPLYRIDMIGVFSGLFGKPEAAFARACHMLESMAPAVVWFDEIEAGINAQAKEGELGRIFAFFLTWMQEKARGLFVGATANRIDLLPAEMIRKGRFDEVFFVDLPLDDERLEIFKVHLRRRGIDPDQFNLESVKKFTKGWTGAEIEQCVVSALTAAHLQDRALAETDLFNATGNVVPLSKTMKEQVEHIRAWAFDRAVRASPREGR